MNLIFIIQIFFNKKKKCFIFERMEGIEPSSFDWKSKIISLYTTPAIVLKVGLEPTKFCS